MIALFLSIFIISVTAEPDYRTVVLDDGVLQGEKYWDGEFYEFYGIPYARAPTGKDKFKAPLPVHPWPGVVIAGQQGISCHQRYNTGDDDDVIIDGEVQCLVLNVFVPEIASEDNLLPVVVYIHSGAYSGGNGNMARYHYLARQDIIVISINYRLGAIGFACLGNEEIPGNAAMKDQVAALRWVNKNIKKFGGDPNKVTVAGFSVGAAMAELLTLSKSTNGLIDKLILESASALSPFAINRDPVNTAKNIAISVGYNGTGTIEDLTKFYLNASIETLTKNSQHFFLTNSTFGFAPCTENVFEGVEPFLTESPLDILRKGSYEKVALLTGFSNMEGLSRTLKFEEWSTKLNENFEPFLPADLVIPDTDVKETFIKILKELYFKGKEVSVENLQGYIDYFSDSMFKYSILKSASLHAKNSNRPVFFYEFSYVGNLNMKHYYMDRIKGASHRDQTSYILEFNSYTNDYNDLDIRDRMTWMWADFIKHENPTAYESPLIDFKWQPFVDDKRNYLQINNTSIMKNDLLQRGYQLWDGVYGKYYWTPKSPEVALVKNNENKEKAPLPVHPWPGVVIAGQQGISCHQRYNTGDDDDVIIDGEVQCLVLNVFVPEIASEDNLLPVVVYIHSGAYSGGNGNMARYHYLARQDIIVISINYRLGAIGFACLGNEEIPGNAAMKDQVAALRWVNKNIKKFGGDPNKVTVAGFSVGAAMAELLTLSKSTNGLIDKLILESASALSPFAINRDPVNTAKNIAISVGYNGTGTIEDLTKFYLNASIETLTKNSQHFFLTNSTFGFAPCIENVFEGVEPFLTESPLDILRKGSYEKVALLTGFSNMEGLSRTLKFEEWSTKLNENFEPFLPADLAIPDTDVKEAFIKQLKELYFKGKEVSVENLQGYIDYFSDSMFKYSILKSASLHAKNSNRPVFFYEFSYVGNLNMKHYYMDRIKGASHRDQTSYILEFNSYTNDYNDLDIRDRMTWMWADFIKHENPTAYESPLIDFKWQPFVDDKRNYLQINNTSIMKNDLLQRGYQLWDGVYGKYYWTPKAPEVTLVKNNENKEKV